MNNEEQAAVRAEKIADARTLEMAEENAVESMAEQYEEKLAWQIENELDYVRSEFWDTFYEEALAELKEEKTKNARIKADKILAKLEVTS